VVALSTCAIERDLIRDCCSERMTGPYPVIIRDCPGKM
jgi:hypothetical protein